MQANKTNAKQPKKSTQTNKNTNKFKQIQTMLLNANRCKQSKSKQTSAKKNKTNSSYKQNAKKIKQMCMETNNANEQKYVCTQNIFKITQQHHRQRQQQCLTNNLSVVDHTAVNQIQRLREASLHVQLHCIICSSFEKSPTIWQKSANETAHPGV